MVSYNFARLLYLHGKSGLGGSQSKSGPSAEGRIFFILLTVHLGTILVNNQLDPLFQLSYLFHFSTCFEQPSAHHQENQFY